MGILGKTNRRNGPFCRSVRGWHEPFCALEARRMLALSPIGGEFGVNTQVPGSQVFADVAADADGDFVVAWRSDGQDGDAGGIYAQRYNAAGAPQGGEFRVNTVTAGNQMNPSVAMDDVGNFVVVWEDSTAGKGIMGQRFNAAGTAQGGEFRVISSISGGGIQTQVAMNGTGAFVVTYRGVGTNSNDRGIFARVYNASGVPAGSAFRVNTDLGTMSDTSIAMNDSGNFVVAWSQYPGGAFVTDVFARRYSAAGAPLDAQPITVNTYLDGDQDNPAVAMLPGGGYVVAYSDLSNTRDGLGNGAAVYAQRFDELSNKVAPEFRIGTHLLGDQSIPSVAADPDGTSAVTWHGVGATGTPSDIHVQLFDGDGNPVQGSEQIVNTYLTSNQYVPAAAMSDNNQLTIVWHSAGQDLDASTGVYAQRFEAIADVTPPVVTSPQFAFAAKPRPELRLEFNKDLNPASVQNTDLQLTNQVTGQTIPSASIVADYDDATRTIVFTFPGLPGGALPDGNYRAVLLDGSVTDTGGTALENEYVFPFFTLAGDANRDRRVDQADEAILNANFGNTNATFAQGDFNYDGTINDLDRDMLEANWLLWLPVQGQSIFLGYSGGKTVNELRAEPGARLAVWSGTAAQVTLQYRFPTAAAGSMSVSGDYPGELSLAIVGLPAAADGISFSGSQITFAGGFTVNHSLVDHLIFDGQGGWDALTLAGSLAVTFTAPQEFDSLTIASGATATLAAGGNKTVVTRSLTGGGRLDLTDNDLVIDYSSVSPVGVWTGSAYDGVSGLVKSASLFSSHASGMLKTPGLAEAREALGITGTQTATFAGQSVDSTSVLVRFTWGGDATLDGKINIDDYGRIDGNVAQSGSVFGWFNGDFNLDGKINIDDYGIIDGNINQQNQIL